MIATQRRREIVAMVRSGGSARVSDLARSLEVTEETIRRDLRELDEAGQLVRTHGGAVAAEPTDDHAGRADLPYDHRSIVDRAEKRAIAAAALALIQPGQVVALDASSTACELAYRLPDEPLTVVTNSLVICSALADRKHVDVVCTGGKLDPQAMAFHGPDAERAVARHNIHRLFFSCRGIDPQRGLSEANDAHAAIKRSLLDATQHAVLLADHSKLGLRSAVFFAPGNVPGLLLTNQTDRAEARRVAEALHRAGVDVQTVDAPR